MDWAEVRQGLCEGVAGCLRQARCLRLGVKRGTGRVLHAAHCVAKSRVIDKEDIARVTQVGDGGGERSVAGGENSRNNPSVLGGSVAEGAGHRSERPPGYSPAAAWRDSRSAQISIGLEQRARLVSSVLHGWFLWWSQIVFQSQVFRHRNQ